MSVIEYGALLRVNGKFINKNCDLFMDSSDTSYVCDKAIYFNSVTNETTEIDINGNFYVYAGDENFMLCFYRGCFYVIHNNKIIYLAQNIPFLSETIYLDGFPTIKVDHLDKNIYIEPIESMGTWKDYVKEHWIGITGDEKLSDLQNGHKRYKWFQKRLKQISRERKHPSRWYKYRTQRWKATWDYNGNHYEVIFGYGIEPIKMVWDDIKFNKYNFMDIEREIIDSCFLN